MKRQSLLLLVLRSCLLKGGSRVTMKLRLLVRLVLLFTLLLSKGVHSRNGRVSTLVRRRRKRGDDIIVFIIFFMALLIRVFMLC